MKRRTLIARLEAALTMHENYGWGFDLSDATMKALIKESFDVFVEPNGVDTINRKIVKVTLKPK